jgi:hypothetical protein
MEEDLAVTLTLPSTLRRFSLELEPTDPDDAVPLPCLASDRLATSLAQNLQGVVDITLSGPIVLGAEVWDGDWPVVEMFHITLSVMRVDGGWWYDSPTSTPDNTLDDRTRIVEGFNTWLLAMARGVGRMKRVKRCAVEMNVQSTSAFEAAFDGEKRKWEVVVGLRAEWSLGEELKKEWEGMVGKEGLGVVEFG